MNKINGKLIVVTGVDGSGKTVQSDILVKRLEVEGYSVEQMDFPQYGQTFFADMIARYLRGDFSLSDSSVSSSQSVNPYFTSLLYAGDRWETVSKVREWLKSGKIVISNRHTCCNKAYQGAKINDCSERLKFYEWIDKLEHEVYGIPVPDKIVFLHNDVKIALDLISKRKSREYCHPDEGGVAPADVVKDIHEEDTSFLETVQERYLELASSTDGWSKIECVRDGELLSKDEIAGKIWNVVNMDI